MTEGYRTEGGSGRVKPGSTTVYKIRDAEGRLVAEHHRIEKPGGDKDCLWKRPGTGPRTWGLNGTRLEELPLYGAEQVGTWDEDDLVVLTEGEKARDAMDHTDFFCALGTVCGSGVVPGAEALEVLRSRRVALWPDNDEQGRKHMERIAERLHGVAAEVLVYEWDDAPKKGDAADHPAVQSRDRAAHDKLLTDLESAPRWKPGTGAGPEIEDVVAASVETKPVEWLWNGRIPKGKLTIFDGDPDLGKSVVTMDIAARVSTGRPFPDGAPCEAGNVLVANVEDGIDDTIVPRLRAHGADAERVFIFASSVPDGRGGTRLLELPQDIGLLENKVLQREAALLIIDPVMTMLGGDANKDQDARKALTPLRDMAERTGVSVVAVRHLNKSVGLKAIQRGGGNMGLIGVARAGSFFAEHPDDDRLRVMAAHKSNLAERPPSLSYRIVSSTVHNTARIEWTGTTIHDANSLASAPASPAEKTKQEEAKEFLRDELGAGPMWAKQVFKDAHDAGISQGTLYIAKSQLRVRSEKVGTDGWQWSLPEREDDKPPEGPEPLEPLEPLEPSNESPSDSAYLVEDDKDGKDGKDSKGSKDHRAGEGAYDLRLIREVFDNPQFYGPAARAIGDFYKEPSAGPNFQVMCRSVLLAAGRDPNKWRDYSDVIYRVAGELHAGVPE